MAIWNPDLANRHGPQYLRVVEAMAEDIAAGRLAPSTQLPPYRELAYQLDLSPNTISRAYTEAIRRGHLRGEVGRGTFVRAADGEARTASPETLRRFRDGHIDLSRNLPLPGFAEPYIREALSGISKDASLRALLDYQTDHDLSRHAEAGLTWLESCGVTSSADQVITTMGGQHGLFCILIAVLKPGDLLLTEALTYMPVCAMAERLGLHVKTVSMDAEGVLPGSFDDLCTHARPKAFYLTPTLQAPTTVTLSEARRLAIAEIAEKHRVLLIEDDVFAPLKQNRPAPLAKHAPEQTIYVTSLSKAIAPGLRVGFLSTPFSVAPAVRHAVNMTVWMTPPINLEVAGRLILGGNADKIAAQQRAAAKHRQALAQSILEGIDYQADPFGLHLWIPLRKGRRADMLRAQCARGGILVSEGRSFALDALAAPEALRVCLGHEPDEERLKQGLESVANLLRAESTDTLLEI